MKVNKLWNGNILFNKGCQILSKAGGMIAGARVCCILRKNVERLVLIFGHCVSKPILVISPSGDGG